MSRTDTERYLRIMGYGEYVDAMIEREQTIIRIDDQKIYILREQIKWAQKRIAELEAALKGQQS
jgi:hypothetical protein